MTDYKKLVKNLRSCALHKCDCEESVKDGCWDGMMTEAADAIEKLLQDISTWIETANMLSQMYNELADEIPDRWISVKERLPEEDGWYQVYAPYYSGGSSSGLKNINGNMYSAYKHGKWSIEVGYHKRPGCVKAWMPLPEPPKEETE